MLASTCRSLVELFCTRCSPKVPVELDNPGYVNWPPDLVMEQPVPEELPRRNTSTTLNRLLLLHDSRVKEAHTVKTAHWPIISIAICRHGTVIQIDNRCLINA